MKKNGDLSYSEYDMVLCLQGLQRIGGKVKISSEQEVRKPC